MKQRLKTVAADALPAFRDHLAAAEKENPLLLMIDVDVFEHAPASVIDPGALNCGAAEMFAAVFIPVSAPGFALGDDIRDVRQGIPAFPELHVPHHAARDVSRLFHPVTFGNNLVDVHGR